MRRLLIITGTLYIALIIAGVFINFNKDIPDAVKWPIEDFSYINQDGEPFTDENLKGKITVADFIYTSCPSVCIPMTANMVKLQEMAKTENLNVQFVSFSVDPKIDTADVLKEYGEKFHVNFTNWNFLTGYSEEEIVLFAKNNFKTLVQKATETDIIHGTRFYLIDQNGDIVKEYSGAMDPPYEEIIEHIKILQDKY